MATTPETTAVWELPRRLGLEADLEALQIIIADWIDGCDTEVRDIVRRQLAGRAKYFRPVAIFSCYRAVTDRAPAAEVLAAAAALELIHNVSLIIDDILDRSRYRRGTLSLHCRFGFLPALMTAGYITAGGSRLVATDSYSVNLLAALVQRLGVAECLQWRLRRHPLGVEDWHGIAGEDTGSMFETCARLGTRDDRLAKFGYLLGILYHGCDDVADVRGTTALGGGKAKDIQDGILTLPAAIATRDPATALLFGQRDHASASVITERLVQALPAAERYLDTLAVEAETEARTHAPFPDRLLRLIEHTRALSQS
ncbi:MAG: polyprenyl synthetase family protein [Chloroflexia bacterium]|nr:polyprenyl synthetase family protein [Chloroflexia bacterium]